MSSLKAATEACLHIFALVCDHLNQQGESGVLRDVQDEFDRVRVWSANLGALAKGHSSLEWRLREADLMRSTILTLLELLRTTLLRIVDLLPRAEVLPNPETIVIDVSDTISLPSDSGSEDSECKTSDLDSLVVTIREFVSNLYQLSFRIRNSKTRPSKASFYKEIDSESGCELFGDCYAKHDLDHVHELVKDLRQGSRSADDDETLLQRLHVTEGELDFSVENLRLESSNPYDDVLLQRLALANTTRRRKMRYWQNHAKKLAFTSAPAILPPDPQKAQEKSHQAASSPGEVDLGRKPAPISLGKSIYTTTEATEPTSDLDLTPLETESVISVATTAYDLEGRVANLPPPPREAAEDTDFTCPYCRVLCPSRHGNGRAWRAHVIQDLEPYTCTYVECSSGARLYGSRSDWLDHENKRHRSIWKCCYHTSLEFSTLQALKSHLQRDHAFTGSETDELVSISQYPKDDDREECPICLESTEHIKNLPLHIANHMERIATFSLPRYMDPEDDTSIVSDKAVPESRSDQPSLESGSLGGSMSDVSSRGDLTLPNSASDVVEVQSLDKVAANDTIGDTSYTIGWVAVLTSDFQAAEGMLDFSHRREPTTRDVTDNNLYVLGQVANHNVVIAGSKSSKRASATTVVTRMLSTFASIRVVLLVGAGAGLPLPSVGQDIRLGDVVVGYSRESLGGIIKYRLDKDGSLLSFGRVKPPPRVIRDAIINVRTKHEQGHSQVLSHIEDMARRSPETVGSGKAHIYQGSEDDRLFEADYPHPVGYSDCSKCDSKKEIKRDPRPDNMPRFHYGAIASTNFRNSDERITNQLAQDCLCCETSASGLSENLPCLMIKGICNYADSHTNRRWLKYACAVSAAYAKELLQSIPPQELVSFSNTTEVTTQAKNAVEIPSVSYSGTATLSRRDVAIFDWLSPTDQSEQKSQIMSELPAINEDWFIEDKSFQSWITGPPKLMFCTGATGTGKTVLAAAAAEYLESHTDRATTALAFVFCRPNVSTIQGMFLSVLKQLSSPKIPLEVTRLYNDYSATQELPSIEKIVKALRTTIFRFQRAFVILDGLDDLTHDSGDDFFISMLRQLSYKSNLCLLVTARLSSHLEEHAKEHFPDYLSFDIPAFVHDNVPRVVQNRLLIPHANPELLQNVVDTVLERSDGILTRAFGYISFLEAAPRTAQGIRDALEDLP